MARSAVDNNSSEQYYNQHFAHPSPWTSGRELIAAVRGEREQKLEDSLCYEEPLPPTEARHVFFPPPYPPCAPTVVTPPLRTHFYDPAEVPKYYKPPPQVGWQRNVFDRLTDPSFYTGAHRERFDEFGNGRGMAGREYLFLHDGFTESPSRTHEVYSSVIRKPRKLVVTPGTVGMQRFGVQIAAPPLMWLFRNGDKHHDGTPFFVRNHIKTMECLYAECTKKITPFVGPLRKIFDQNLKPVRSLEEIIDGAKYLCSSGEPPAPPDRLEKFLSDWIIQKSQSKQRSDFFVI